MILGVGIDIVRTARFAEIIAKTPHRLPRLLQRILHPAEISSIPSDAPIADIARKLASSWAAKEALYKSLAPSDQKNCIFNEWRREFTANGQEMLRDGFKDQVLVSVSHDGEYTIAYALRQRRSKL